MSDPVVIGIREVYQAVTDLGAKFDAFAKSTALDVALLQQRVLTLEKERADEKARRWQLYVALIAAAVAIGVAILK